MQVHTSVPDNDAHSEQRIHSFCSWCTNVDVDTSNVKFSQTNDRGLCLLAVHSIEAGKPALSVPVAALLSVAGALRSDVGQAVLRSNAVTGRAVSARALMYIVMIDGRSRTDSPWHSYLNLIPSTHHDPLWWGEDERSRLLTGTQLLHDANSHNQHLKQLYSAFFPALSEESPNMFPSDRFTWEAFLWARSSLSSRCFSDSSLSVTLAGKQDDPILTSPALQCVQLTDAEAGRLELDCPALLCPFLDITNHDHDSSVSTGLLQGTDGVLHLGLSVHGGVAAGSEIFNNYGKIRTNLQLLLGHGFCVPRNENDVVPLRLGAGMASSPAFSAYKQQLLDRCGLRLDELHELSRTQLLPPRLLATLRVFLAKETALQDIVKSIDDSDALLLATFSKPMLPVARDPDCEQQVLSIVMQQLEHKTSLISGAAVSEHAGHAERHAYYYRKGQLEILESCKQAAQHASDEWCQQHGSFKRRLKTKKRKTN